MSTYQEPTGANATARPEVQELASAGFANGTVYETGRPGYAAEAVAFLVEGLGVTEGRTVLDLGVGTGKVTRQLVPFGADLVAVEPSAAVREEFARQLPGVPVLDGSGEAIPLGDNTLDAVIVAQAFHWFDAPRALAEIARVLRPGGCLGMIWNERDECETWASRLSEAMHWHERQPYPVGMDFRPIVLGHPAFVEGERRQFRFAKQVDHARLRQRVLSTSYIAAAPQDEQAGFRAAAEVVIAQLPEPVDLPYLTDAYVFQTGGRA